MTISPISMVAGTNSHAVKNRRQEKPGQHHDIHDHHRVPVEDVDRAEKKGDAQRKTDLDRDDGGQHPEPRAEV